MEAPRFEERALPIGDLNDVDRKFGRVSRCTLLLNPKAEGRKEGPRPGPVPGLDIDPDTSTFEGERDPIIGSLRSNDEADDENVEERGLNEGE